MLSAVVLDSWAVVVPSYCLTVLATYRLIEVQIEGWLSVGDKLKRQQKRAVDKIVKEAHREQILTAYNKKGGAHKSKANYSRHPKHKGKGIDD